MKYYGKLENLQKIGYRWNESYKCYQKQKGQSGVLVYKATKQVEYWGKDSKELLQELGALKND